MARSKKRAAKNNEKRKKYATARNTQQNQGQNDVPEDGGFYDDYWDQFEEDPEEAAQQDRQAEPAKEPMASQELQSLAEEEQKRRTDEDDGALPEVSYQPEKYQYFHPEEFEKGLHLSPALRKKAQNLIEHDAVRMTQFLTGTENKLRSTKVLAEGIYQVKDNGFYGESPFRLVMLFDQTHLIYAQCDDWDCVTERDEASYFGRTLCVHEAAGLLLMEAFLTEHNDTDATTPNMSRFMRSLENQSGTELTAQDDLRGELLHMEPTLRYTDFGTLQCRFRVGAGRLYQIKDLEEFYDHMEAGREMRFGKKTVLQLDRSFLDDRSQDWYDLLAAGVEDRRSRETVYRSRSSSVQGPKDAIDLYGTILDQFLELADGMTLECKNDRQWTGRDKVQWTVTHEPLQLHLRLTPDYNEETGTLDGVVLQGTVPVIFRGARSACCLIDESRLIRVDMAEMKQLLPLRAAADFSGDILMKVGRFRMGEFYHKVLPRIRQIAEVEEEDPGLVNRYLPPEPSFTLYLDYSDGRVYCRAEAAYGRDIFRITDLLDWEQDYRNRTDRDQFRDEAAEGNVLDTALEYFSGYIVREQLLVTDEDEDEIFDILDHGLDDMMRVAEVRVTDRFRRLGLRRNIRVRVGVSLESNLLDLSVSSQDVSEDELLNILAQYQQKRKFIRLRNGDFLKLQENESVGQLAQLMEELHLSVQDMTKGHMNVPAYRSLYLDKMLEGRADVYADRDRHFRELIKEFKTISDSEYDVPANLEDTIRPYQREGYQWLRTLDHYGFGGILADEMGLGKTLQALACLEAVHEEELDDDSRPHTSLVVCPASLVYNWLEEVRKFAPSLRALAVTGSAPERAALIQDAAYYDILITSYDLLKRDIQEYDRCRFRFEIIDEAQYIKNHNTAASKSVKLIHADTRFALTGTPIENRLSELWSIFDYLMPGFLYDYTEFRDTWEKPIVKFGDEDTMERLRRMIAPFILRRRKADVLKDLPEKIEEIHYAGMGPRQRKLYDAQVVKMRREINAQDESDFRKNQIQILAELMRIRQICCDPDLFLANYHGGSCKTDMCLDLIDSLIDGGHKALLFSQFTSMLEILQQKLDEKGIAYYVITGQTPKEKRLELVNRFNSDDTPVFLISLKAGGTGLNLTGADTVIHYDPWWNTAAEDQATDRAHRIGQTSVVTVYKLVVKDTIEERIIDLQNQKAKLAEDLLAGDAVSSSTFTKEDLLHILG